MKNVNKNKVNIDEMPLVTVILPKDMSQIERLLGELLADSVCDMLSVEAMEYVITELEKEDSKPWNTEIEQMIKQKLLGKSIKL